MTVYLLKSGEADELTTSRLQTNSGDTSCSKAGTQGARMSEWLWARA